MLEVVVYKDCVEGRLATLLWGYGKLTSATLSFAPSRTGMVVKEDGKETPMIWPTLLELAVKDAPTESILVPATEAQKVSALRPVFNFACQRTMYSWIDFAYQRDFSIMESASLKILNDYILNHTFLAGPTVTLADLVVYVSTHSWMMKSEPQDRAEYVNVVRWFDHIQHLPGIVNTFKELPLVSVDKDMDVVTAVMEKATVSAAAPAPAGKQAKGQKGAASKKPKDPKPPADDRPIADVSRLNIKVGQIMSVERHPEADKLYCLKVDLGEPELRDICSGLVGYLEPEQIMSQYVCVLSNMKPKSLRGKVSNGMILCVSGPGKTELELLHPAEGAPVGERIIIEDCVGEPDAVLSTKTGKDPFVAVQPEFNCKDTVAYYKDHRFMTSCGPCRCNSLKAGTIS
ncbi:tRNA binding domain containing protein, putative [Babesia bigemina]|uniref:tRNA binding domain containing protein, putative n=1 Tax=Babesia bigemina TaxID=5866 RepID=A0A061CZ31_BABBI|nr:tRNA binding domain containing protein, putative [Babesia bigemina]CDR93881.1 tRNA binding domain containing protein, putative [Babesia bigemina]|eukprot:XP_012766067.1 tRNA binding domain containing protein, putative [Babesia bigemina]